jgi:AraC family transcriptional regulator, exoenzyme S synthesis regulatory protein ExsA
MAESIDKGGIFFNTEADERRLREQIVPYHALGRIISGETHVEFMGKHYIFGPGSTVLGPRNQLARMTKMPKDGEPYRSVSIFFPEDFLRRYYADNKVLRPPQLTPEAIQFERHPLLDSLFNSLLPYFNLPGELPPAVADLKMEEAVTVLRNIDPNTDALLGNFDRPGKIALADFMEKNYMYNLPMERFGFLTGRSLTTFKRDFRNAFHAPFQQWITRKRLELAHHYIFALQRKPTDVYLDVGFENLSHFSFAFKKHFGYNPTRKFLAHGSAP